MMVFSDGRDVTFVVQGSIDHTVYLNRCISSIRRYFPAAKVCISTSSAILPEHHDLDVDELVVIDDVGAVNVDDVRNIKYNVNRQISTTLAGLKKVTTKYAVKVRTDSYFFNNKLLVEYARLQNEWGNAVDGTPRMLCISEFTRNPRCLYEMPFHMSDFLYLSTTKNLLLMFEAPLMKDEETRWFFNREVPKNAPASSVLHLFSAEQHLWLGYLRAKGVSTQIAHAYDNQRRHVDSAELSFRNYALMLPAWKLGLAMSKKEHRLMYLKSYDSYSMREFRNILNGEAGSRSIFDIELWFLRLVSMHSLAKRKILSALRYKKRLMR